MYMENPGFLTMRVNFIKLCQKNHKLAYRMNGFPASRDL